MNELLHRAAAFQPQSFNPEARTVSVIFSSGALVRRFDFDGPYEERLDLAPEAVDLSQLIGGPVLNSHDRFDVNSILGVVETAQVDGQRGTATIRFSERAASIMADVRDGIIKSVSVGYVINQRRVDKDPTNGARIITATRWTPKEISFVAIPADPAAKVRGGNMDKPEQKHANDIRSIGELAGMSAEQTASMVERNLSSDEARREAFEHLKKRNGPPIRTAHPAHVGATGYDDPVFLRKARLAGDYKPTCLTSEEQSSRAHDLSRPRRWPVRTNVLPPKLCQFFVADGLNSELLLGGF